MSQVLNFPPHRGNLLFRRHLDHLASRLHPLISVSTGRSHPAFPQTLLHYHILTEEQLDDMAHHYHQRTPTQLSLCYPAPVVTRWRTDADISDKRRRFGRFIGLRGCESPGSLAERSEEEQEVERWVEDRIRQGMARDRELEAWKSKGF